ncbi:MAG: hypothetical protein KF868_09160 [Acidobacteria bacterium]|nr:hypothetical protein [Acidobacteriota bacterium]MCW5968333.1 hypothetical protein [Blastocatellales bacterium]
MSIRFQADNDLNARIIDATLPLNPEIDFNTAASAGFHTGVPDLEVLVAAAEEGADPGQSRSAYTSVAFRQLH